MRRFLPGLLVAGMFLVLPLAGCGREQTERGLTQGAESSSTPESGAEMKMTTKQREQAAEQQMRQQEAANPGGFADQQREAEIEAAKKKAASGN